MKTGECVCFNRLRRRTLKLEWTKIRNKNEIHWSRVWKRVMNKKDSRGKRVTDHQLMVLQSIERLKSKFKFYEWTLMAFFSFVCLFVCFLLRLPLLKIKCMIFLWHRLFWHQYRIKIFFFLKSLMWMTPTIKNNSKSSWQ